MAENRPKTAHNFTDRKPTHPKIDRPENRPKIGRNPTHKPAEKIGRKSTETSVPKSSQTGRGNRPNIDRTQCTKFVTKRPGKSDENRSKIDSKTDPQTGRENRPTIDHKPAGKIGREPTRNRNRPMSSRRETLPQNRPTLKSDENRPQKQKTVYFGPSSTPKIGPAPMQLKGR